MPEGLPGSGPYWLLLQRYKVVPYGLLDTAGHCWTMLDNAGHCWTRSSTCTGACCWDLLLRWVRRRAGTCPGQQQRHEEGFPELALLGESARNSTRVVRVVKHWLLKI